MYSGVTVGPPFSSLEIRSNQLTLFQPPLGDGSTSRMAKVPQPHKPCGAGNRCCGPSSRQRYTLHTQIGELQVGHTWLGAESEYWTHGLADSAYIEILLS